MCVDVCSAVLPARWRCACCEVQLNIAPLPFQGHAPTGTITNNLGVWLTGSNSVSTSCWYRVGSTATVTAVQTRNNLFVGWSGTIPPNVNTNAPKISFVVTSTVSLTAVFDLDSDGDGIPDWWEVKYGLNPSDPSDASKSINFDGTNNLTAYQLYGSSFSVAPMPANTPPPTLDSDGDGISDYQENLFFKTDPNNRDSDGDGLSDGDEIYIYGTNPLKADTDGGGVPDGREVAHGLKPRDPADDTAPVINGVRQ
jgi:hypothetical protein